MESLKPLISVCYARVSTTQQEYQRQIENVETYAKAYNHQIIKTFTEKESGTHKKRPALTEMFKYLQEFPCDFVLLDELSRLGRTSEVLNSIEKLNELKIGLISLKENIITLNADKSVNHTSSLILGVLSSINSYELSTTKYRARTGLLSGAKAGRWQGGKMLPYGYMRDRDLMLAINTDEAQIVREIFDMYLNQGFGINKISTILNSRNIPTRTNKRWSDSSIYSILTNTIMKGLRKYKNLDVVDSKGKQTYIEIEAPQIVNAETFDAVQKMLKSKLKMAGINRKHTYLLDDKLIKCGVCGKSYYAYYRPPTDRCYKCISSRYFDKCDNIGINIDKLEFVVKYLMLKKLSDLIKHNKDYTKEITEVNQVKKGYEVELKKLENKESNLIELFTDELITKENLQIKLKELQEKKLSFSEEILKLQAKVDEYNEAMRNLEQIDYLTFNTGTVRKLPFNKENVKQVIKSITIEPHDAQISDNKQDKCIRAIVTAWNNKSFTALLSQRTKYFILLGSERKIEYVF